ncbi:MAG: ribonuclease HI family protein [Thermodesulfobacteriota bacterium]
MSAPEAPTLAAVLAVLAGRLPDSLLGEYFPDAAPAHIRQLLRQGAGSREEAPAPLPAAKPAAPIGRLTISTDGASKNNPGPAGAGAVIEDAQGNRLAEVSRFLGICTNNVAEYQAVLLGLAEASRLGAQEVLVRVDSELLARQVAGVYRVKDVKLQPLYAQVMARLRRFARYEVRHVPREQNQAADALANRAVREAGRSKSN